MEEQYEMLCKMIAELQTIWRSQLVCPELRKHYLSRNSVKDDLQFSHTQLSVLTKKYHLVTVSIGKQVFYYVPNLLATLEKNIIK